MKTVVGVLRGGPSSEYEVSIKSGASVLSALDQNQFKPIDIFIDRQGHWHSQGVELEPEKALRAVDVAFTVLHGEYGESGEVQKLLQASGTPYTGSDSFSSVLAFNKHTTKEIVSKEGVKVAHGKLLQREESPDLEELALQLFRTFPHPAILKPVVGGSSVGMTLARSFHELVHALYQAFSIAPTILIEEFIKGREATVGVVEHFRGEPLYTLMPVEIIPPPEHDFFNYEAKYNGKTIERVPGHFSDAEKKTLAQYAKTAHTAIGASHYSRSDFIVTKRGIYFLEINSAAAVGLTSESLFPKAVEAGGTTFTDFLTHVLALALEHKRS